MKKSKIIKKSKVEPPDPADPFLSYLIIFFFFDIQHFFSLLEKLSIKGLTLSS